MVKTSDKILLKLAKDSKLTKIGLAKELGISRPTLDQKLKDNAFSGYDILILKAWGLE
jgi:predicted ArsR family transcriptional regulator